MLHGVWLWLGANWAWATTAEAMWYLGLWAGNRHGRRAERRRLLRWLEGVPAVAPRLANEFPGLLTMPEGWVEEGRN